MQLLSNFMANWVGEKKKRKTKITESRITTLTAHPTPARPDTPSPPFQLGGPLHPTPPAPQGHLRLFGFARGFAILFPPSPSQNQCQPLQQPHPWAKPEPGAPGQVQPHHRSIFPIHAGTSPPPAPAAGTAYAATDAASHGASSPAARGLANSSHVSAGCGPTPAVEAEQPSRGAGQPSLQRSFICPYFWSPIKVFPLTIRQKVLGRAGKRQVLADAASSDLGPGLGRSARVPLWGAAN